MGRHQGCLSSSGIYDAAIRCRATKITDRLCELRMFSTASSIWMVGRHKQIDHQCSSWGKHWMKKLPIMSEGSGSHALSRASAWMLREPGRWTGMSLMSFRLQNLRRWIVRQVSLNDLVPPSLMMYDTTMALSYIRHSTRDLSWGKNPATPGSTASISNILMCWFACCLDNVHCSLWEPSYAPICGWRHL